MPVHSQQPFPSLSPYLMCNPLPASPTGILCLASGCYVRCLNPTSHVSLLGAAIATQAVGTAMANPRDTAREHDVTYRQGQGRTAGERVMPDQVSGTEPANKGRTPSRIGENKQCTWGVGEGENPVSRTGLAPSRAAMSILRRSSKASHVLSHRSSATTSASTGLL